MKKSIGTKLLAGIVCASMILGIPVTGYSQEEEALLAVIASDEEVQQTEEVLAGVSGTELEAVETPIQGEEADVLDEEEFAFDEASEDEEAIEDILIASDEETEEESPEDGILLEEAEEEDILEAADGKTAPTPVEVDTEEKLINAIGQAVDGATILLTDNITATGSIFMDNEDLHMLSSTKTFTIDLNDRTLTVPDGYGFFLGAEKTLTLTNGTFEGTVCVEGGTINLPADVEIVGAMCIRIRKGGMVNMDGAKVKSSHSGTATEAVWIDKGTLNMTKGSIIVTEDNRRGLLLSDADSVVNMTNGNIELDANGTAVVMGKGTMTVKEGTCTIKSESGSGVYVEGGSFTISKGTILSKGTAVALGANNGVDAAIRIEGTQDSTRILSTDDYAVYEKGSDNKGSIRISGGYFENNSGTEDIYCENKTKIITVTSNAVGFYHNVNRKYLPNENCRTKDDDGDNIYLILQLDEKNSAAAYIRPNGKATFYTETVQEAMDVISGEEYSPKTGDTVKLLKDITPATTDEPAITVGIDRTIDLNKHLLRTQMTVADCKVTIKNGTLESYTDDYALVIDAGADVTLDSTLTVKSPGKNAIEVGGVSSKSYKLTVKCKVEALKYAMGVNEGDITIDINSATITSTEPKVAGIRVNSTATGAKISITNSKITGHTGLFAAAGEITITNSTITGNGEQEGNPDPGTTGFGSSMWIKAAKLTIKSGTFTSEKGHALYLEAAPASGSEISAGTFRSGKSNWDAVSGKTVAKMFTGGTYYPNTKNDMKDGVDTAKCALVGVTDGTFYVAAYDKVMSTLYAANASATKLTVGAAAAGKLITGCKAHAAFLNLSGDDISLLIGTDDKITKNKGTLPKTATTEAWIFHNDLVKLTATANKTATCTLPAVSADCWYCPELKKAYDDAEGQTENTTVITTPAKGHTWGAWNANGDRTCSVCGAKEHDASKAQPAYQISGRPTGVKAKAAGGRKLTVSWKKPAASKLKKIKGFYIEVATDKAFTNIVKTRKVKKTKTSYTFKKLTKGQKYFVRVRFYKGAKISRWSAVKQRKVK